MMDTAPKLGAHVTVNAPAHPHNGETGTVAGYHGRLDCVYVALPNIARDQLIPIVYLTEVE